MSLNSLWKEGKKVHSPVLPARRVPGLRCLSEGRVLVVDGPQMAPGGGVHFVVRVPRSAGRLGLQVPQAVGQFLGRRHQVEDLLWGRGAAREPLWAEPPRAARRAQVGKGQL